jgi:hypothetical protein
MTMDWPTFYAEIQKDKTHGFEDRLGMLDQIASQFAKVKHFNDIPMQERLGIAGLRSKAWASPSFPDGLLSPLSLVQSRLG